MIQGFLLGLLAAVIIAWIAKKEMCGHRNTTHVSKCRDCGYIFNDSIEEMRKK